MIGTWKISLGEGHEAGGRGSKSERRWENFKGGKIPTGGWSRAKLLKAISF